VEPAPACGTAFLCDCGGTPAPERRRRVSRRIPEAPALCDLGLAAAPPAEALGVVAAPALVGAEEGGGMGVTRPNTKPAVEEEEEAAEAAAAGVSGDASGSGETPGTVGSGSGRGGEGERDGGAPAAGDMAIKPVRELVEAVAGSEADCELSDGGVGRGVPSAERMVGMAGSAFKSTVMEGAEEVRGAAEAVAFGDTVGAVEVDSELDEAATEAAAAAVAMGTAESTSIFTAVEAGGT
jgi:hypothetical protein